MKNLLIFLLATILGIQINAQTFEEYKKKKEGDIINIKGKQKDFINRIQNEYKDYVKQRDQEFIDYLKNSWEQFVLIKGLPPPEMPKPVLKPEYIFEPFDERQRSILPANIPLEKINKEIIKESEIPIIQRADDEEYNKESLTFIFFGLRITFDYDQKIKFDPPSIINPLTISKFWKKLSETNYSGLVNQFQKYKTDMTLNDYGYFLMVQQFAEMIYPNSNNGADLLTWNLITRSGYRSRIAYADDKVSLLIPSMYTLYSKNFINFNGLNYYLNRDIGMKIYTYDKDYQDANNLIDYSFEKPINLISNVIQKTFNFSYNDKHYSFNLKVNKNLIDFYKDYPQTNLIVYFDAPVSSESKESIIENFTSVIKNMSEVEAIDFLLKFVQNSFNYQSDQKQFFKEKVFFPEEILYYPFSDCEDRSIFFAYLVKTLLNNRVIGIEYPGHIATAVNFNSDVKGDFIMYNDEKYIIADPTFKNAPLGLAMPQYRNQVGKIIEIDQFMKKGEKNKSYWDLAYKAGGNRGDNLNDIVYDTEGNAYLTGYFIEKANLEQLDLSGTSGRRSFFVTKYDKYGKTVWAKKAIGSGNATGFSILFDALGDIYIAGSFSGKLDFENGLTSLQSKGKLSDVFISKYSCAGQFKWAIKAGLDSYMQENHLTYLIKCPKNGDNINISFFNENEGFSNFGLQKGPKGFLYLTGTFQKSVGALVGMLPLITNEIKDFNLIESLKLESDKLINANYEKSIAGIFSVLNHIKLTGVKISGEDIKISLDKYNPSFKKLYSEIYSNIGKINFMLNNDGIVKLETLDESSLIIDKLKISSGATLKISSLQNGDAQLDIINGISVGKMVVWFNLNFVKLYKLNGNLLFDYDTDHTQKIMNLKEDILN